MVNDFEGGQQEKDLVGSYFLELWRSKSKRAAVSDAKDVEMVNSDGECEQLEEEEEEPVPTELDTLNSSGGFSIVLPNKLSVKYPSVNLHGHVVQANCHAPVKRLLYYFEIYVKNAGAKGQIAIGFTTEGFHMRRQPGYDDKSAICPMLNCQKFIELIRVGRLEEAVDYGRTNVEKFYNLEEYEDFVRDCAALLAYEDPKKSPVGYLLEDSQLENIADAVNAMILSTNPEVKGQTRSCLHSYLERLLRQLTACFLEKRLLNGNQGEAFHLPRVLLANNS